MISRIFLLRPNPVSAWLKTTLFGCLKPGVDDYTAVCQAADEMRKQVAGDEVTYCVNRNINYTNVCYFKCQFCAFSKGKMSENLRGKPYDLTHEEIMRRTKEAWDRGASEVCLQGGIHPEYTGQTYIDICRSIKQVNPDMHIHAFSPLEVWQGAKTLGIPIPEFLGQLKEAGLGTLPGTAAEILDDEVRATLCPDKINTEQWLEVMEAAHGQGFNTTATIMYGHMEQYKHVARHLLRVRDLQEKTGGFTEFVISAVYSYGIPDLPERSCQERSDLPGSGVDSCDIQIGVVPSLQEHSGILDQTWSRWREGVSAGRGQ